VALQLLYEREHNARMDRAALEQFARERIRDESIREFCLLLFDGVVAQVADIDAKIAAAAENWRVSRMTTVDRNILRLGAFELLFMRDTPAAVVFDEAIELARRYGSGDSSAFVNGVLDRLGQESGVGRQEAVVMGPESGVGSQESGVSSQESVVNGVDSECNRDGANANH
jgi:N utilization substance protein B